LIFLTSAFAETNRLPFDLPESEQELVGGFHTEYSGMLFGMFFLGEYAHVITVSFLTVILFFGGWDFFFLDQNQTGLLSVLAKVIVILVKVTLVILFMMWVRWTLPRFRYDQLMSLAWKSLIPLALINLIATAVIVQLVRSG
jgi:NADH-quinone oxidoreductase subunit H